MLVCCHAFTCLPHFRVPIWYTSSRVVISAQLLFSAMLSPPLPALSTLNDHQPSLAFVISSCNVSSQLYFLICIYSQSIVVGVVVHLTTVSPFSRFRLSFPVPWPPNPSPARERLAMVAIDRHERIYDTWANCPLSGPRVGLFFTSKAS